MDSQQRMRHISTMTTTKGVFANPNTRTVLLWHIVGVVSAVIVLTSWYGYLKVSNQFDDDTRVVLSISRSAMLSLTIFIVSTPILLGALFAWLRLARKFDKFERVALIRSLGLLLTSGLLAVVQYLSIALIFRRPESMSDVMDGLKVGLPFLIEMLLVLPVWALLPRVLVSRLRRPIVPA